MRSKFSTRGRETHAFGVRVGRYTKICSAAFYLLHNIRRTRKYLSMDAAATVIHSFVSSRIDFCNSLLYGVPKCHIDKLQRVSKTQLPDLLLCRANFAILPLCSISCIGFLSHFVLILGFYFQLSKPFMK